jgi:zinc D-Ala-D-Ala carboxypeptidase
MTPWRFFSREELRCRCGCGGGWKDMDPGFMASVSRLRRELGFAFHVSSAYRCLMRDVNSGGHGAHVTGCAIDIAISGPKAYELVSMAAARGFRRIGINQRGPHDERFIHLDMLTKTDGYPCPRIWTY